MRPWILLAGALFALPMAPPLAARPAARSLTDAQIVAYASAPFDKRAMMFKHVLLGRHRGLRVVADHPCGDVCPAYTRRIVSYDVPIAQCARRGGVVREEIVPRGIAVARQAYCKPAVLAGPESKPR
jgi:hypothetical protein